MAVANAYPGLTKLDAEDQASTLVNAADDLSVPFCQLELQLLFKIQVLSDEEGEIGVADAIIQAVKEAVENDKSIWSDLLTGLDAEMTRKVKPISRTSPGRLMLMRSQIREYAETHILSAVSSLAKARTVNEELLLLTSREDHQRMLHRYLSVLNLTAWSIDDKAQSQICAAILEKLRTLLELLSASSQSGQSVESREEITKLRQGSTAAIALSPW